MVVEHNVKGYEQFTNLVGELEAAGYTIFVLFSGGKDENGESWCPYCVTGKHILLKLFGGTKHIFLTFAKFQLNQWFMKHCRKHPKRLTLYMLMLANAVSKYMYIVLLFQMLSNGK